MTQDDSARPHTLLHSRVQYDIAISEPPSWVAEQFFRLRDEDVRVKVIGDSRDQLPFRITRRRSGGHVDVVVEGMLQRWQGTGTRITFTGSVDVPAPDMTFQRIGIVLFSLIPLYGTWQGAMYLLGLPNTFANAFLFCAGTGGMLIGVVFLAWVAHFFLVRAAGGRERWRSQRDMAELVQYILELRPASERLTIERDLDTRPVQRYEDDASEEAETPAADINEVTLGDAQ